MAKQFELSYEQIDVILVDELQETVELNWNGDHFWRAVRSAWAAC